MQTVHTIVELRQIIHAQKAKGKKIGLVPTMGNLHKGHLALVEEAHKDTDFVVATIFVNPTQFGPNEDLDKYPRTLVQDQENLKSVNAHLLFAPSVEEIYPRGKEGITYVSLPKLTLPLCGEHRPGHFDGVTTVVSKLFNMVQPHVACFGQKDYQQLAVIRQMTIDLNFPIEIIGVPTYRAEDGLALSSRNEFLTEKQRGIAPQLQQQLQKTKAAIESGRTDFKALKQEAIAELSKAGFDVDYFDIRHGDTLEKATEQDKKLVIAAAAKLGMPRLIDNITVMLN